MTWKTLFKILRVNHTERQAKKLEKKIANSENTNIIEAAMKIYLDQSGFPVISAQKSATN